MSETAPLGIITGLKFEAAIVNRWRSALGATAPLVRAVGGRHDAAEYTAREMIDKGVQGLVSFGIAGALNTDLKAGTLVLPDRIIAPDGMAFATDEGWSNRLAGQVLRTVQVSRSSLVCVAEPVVTSVQKRELAEMTSTGAVDMESIAVAKVALARDVPFIAVRAIADEADQDLPKAAQVAMASDGSISASKVLFSLITRPMQLAELMRLGRQNAKAKRTLARVAHAGLPWFGLNG